jgi:hypothetical protein
MVSGGVESRHATKDKLLPVRHTAWKANSAGVASGPLTLTGAIMLYLTVGKKKRKPQNDGYIAVITEGVYGVDHDVVVCNVEIVQSTEEAERWFDAMKMARPWEPRN